jgi:hypothetical protein
MLFRVKEFWKLTFLGAFILVTGCSATGGLENRPAPVVRESKMIEEQIALNPAFSAHLTGIRFFEGERSKLAIINDKTYDTRFQKKLARPGMKVYFPIMLYFRQNGKVVRIEEIQARIEPQLNASSHLVGAGYFESGKWAFGDYDVDVYINNKKAATGYFEIY